MIEFYVSPETDGVLLNNYNELFELICETENQLPFEDPTGSGSRSWCFVVHSPHRVFSLYNNMEKGSAIDPNLQEAYDEQVGLLEICTGDYANPQYVAITPNIDMGALKKKWCQDYCVFHELAIREVSEEEETHASKIAGHSSTNRKEFDHVNRI